MAPRDFHVDDDILRAATRDADRRHHRLSSVCTHRSAHSLLDRFMNGGNR